MVNTSHFVLCRTKSQNLNATLCLLRLGLRLPVLAHNAILAQLEAEDLVINVFLNQPEVLA